MLNQNHAVNIEKSLISSPVAKGECINVNGRSRRLWAPFFLRRPMMIVFLISFLSCLGALLALYMYTQRQNHTLGIKTDGDKYYYLWTYGPTAVFTLITAGWTQAEYRASQLMPWVLMHRGPTPATQSIFLDYLSKLNIVALWQSLKQKHFLVSLCVAGSLILNAITVFSTGLFELDSVLITNPINLTVSHKFDSANYDPYSNDAKAFATCMAFFGRNMTRPVGLFENYIYTPFQPTDTYSLGDDTIPMDRRYQAVLDVIEPSFNCQNASVSWESAKKRFDSDKVVYTSADGCYFQRDSPNLVMTESDSHIGLDLSLGGCQGQRFNDSETLASPPYTNDWDADWRIWAAVGPSVVYGMSPEESLNYTAWEGRPMHVTVCKPQYTVYRGPVRIWRDDGQNTISAHVQTEKLSVTDKISGMQAAKLMYSGFQSASKGDSLNRQTTLFGDQFLFAAKDVPRDKFWTDMTSFNDAITESFSCLMQQIVKNKVLQHDPHHAEGTEQFTEDRLFVREMSFYLMAILLVLLIAICIVLLCFHVPVSVCPRDLGSIGGVATVFSQSSAFMGTFDGSQYKSEQEMAQSKLGQAQYGTFVDPKGAFMLVPQDQSPSQSVEVGDEDRASPTWWKSFSSTWFIRITVMVIPIAVIISLEVVYHISTSRRGITLVDGKSTYIHYIWTYIPALIMFIIRCIFTSVEFGTRIVQPYSRLREGLAPPETTILENQLRKIGPYAVFDTIRKRQWSPAAATIALLLTAINPIVVSGLFTAKVSWPTTPMNLTQITRWNLGDPADPSGIMRYWHTQGYNADHAAGLVLNLNLSDPQWTYNNLVFPELSLTSNNASSPDTGFITARLTALRSQLTCALDPANGPCEVRRERLWCEIDSPCFYDQSADGPVNDLDYVFAPPRPLSNKPPSNCSTHAIFYGKKGPNDTPSTNYHYFYCNATIETVEVDTKLLFPSLLIDTETPPSIVEGSARTPFNTNRDSFPGLDLLDYNLFSSDSSFNDNLLETIVKGVNGVPLEELMDPEKLITRVSTVWGIIMAQLLNTGGRESFDTQFNTTYFVEPASMEAPIYTGTFHDGRKYLVQNRLSTRLLDGILGTMIVCALIALYLMRTERVLPKSPTSIASVASFLYGSRILRSFVPNGSEWCSDEELKHRGVFIGKSFSMGWWEVKKQGDWDGSGSSSISTLAEDETEDRASCSRTPTPVSEPDGCEQQIRFGIDVDTADSLLLRDISRI